MTRKLSAAAVVLAIACAHSTVRAPRTRKTPREIFETSKPAIVRIEVADENDKGGVGTGFVIGADGRIATNFHVIDGARRARVIMADGRVFAVQRVIAVDADHDLAIVGIDASGLPVLRIGDSDTVATGDPVYTIGNPQEFDYTISDGLISAVRHVDPNFTILQISAPISQGSSGGPLFNVYGEVIGVATALWKDGQNLNFAMPSNYLRPMVEVTGGVSFQVFATRERVVKGAGDGPGGNIGGHVGSGGGRPGGGPPSITRKIPEYEPSYLEGCTDGDLEIVFGEIVGAIDKGAPLYNAGDHEACFRIYEGVALRLERDLPQACHGPRDALGAGLLRAGTLESFTEKAWAMRDSFDGLLAVIAKRVQTQ